VKLLICAAISLVAHFVIEQVLDLLPQLEPPPPPPAVVSVMIVPPPPPPPVIEPPTPEPPKPEPPKPAPPPKPTPAPPHEVPHPQVAHSSIATAPKDAPPPDHPTVVVPGSDDEPVFNGGNISIEGSSQGTTKPTGPASAPKAPGPGSGATSGHGHGDTIGDFEATKMPLPQGRCFGKYTDDARKAGTEGTVVLDLTVDETGHARDIQVVDALPNGLTEAAVAALRQCNFSPGEKDGAKVAVRVRGFKIRFVLADSN